MAKLYNLARMTTATTGTGTITLGSAVSGFLTFAQAGATNGQTLAYAIRDGANSETGTGTYTTSGTTLTRTVSKSTNSDTAINLSGTAEVFITALAADIANLREANSFTDTTASSSAATGALVVTGGVGVGGTVYTGGVVNVKQAGNTTNSGFRTIRSGGTTLCDIYMGGDDKTYIQHNGGSNYLTFDASTITLNIGTASTSSTTGALVVSGGVGIAENIRTGGGISSAHASTGIGYATGAGGTVTQTGSITTAVTLDKIVGRVVTVSSTLAANTGTFFTVNNSTVVTNDVVVVSVQSTSSAGLPVAWGTKVVSGSFQIILYNMGSVALDNTVNIGFAVIKGVIS